MKSYLNLFKMTETELSPTCVIPESVPELVSTTDLKTELKKLTPEERYKLFNLLSQEENKAKLEKEENEAKEMLKNQCPLSINLSTKLNQVVDEMRAMKKQICDLKLECMNNCMNNAMQCSLGSNNCCEMESMDSVGGECSFFSFSWCPFLIFLAFILLSILMKPMKINPLLL